METSEEKEMPKLTVMEEVLLLGLKDKQVSAMLALLWFSLESPSRAHGHAPQSAAINNHQFFSVSASKAAA